MKVIDALYLEMIRCVARGDETPHRLDERFPTRGTPEHRYRGGDREGDRQALLWEIYLAAEENRSLEEWAATAIRNLMIRVFFGHVEDWNKEFGTPLAKKSLKKGSKVKGVYGRAHRTRTEKLVPLWRHGRKLQTDGRKINAEFYEELGEEFEIKSADDVRKNYWQPMQRFVKRRYSEGKIPD
jgi:hypothetical protein